MTMQEQKPRIREWIQFCKQRRIDSFVCSICRQLGREFLWRPCDHDRVM